MKRNSILPFGLLSVGVLAARVICNAGASQAVVYVQSSCRFGISCFDISSTTLPFAPFKYNLTEITWSEDKEGAIITDLNQKPSPGDTDRRCLKVESGSGDFYLPVDSGPFKKPYETEGDPPIAIPVVPFVKSSGDFAAVVTQCATKRGGRTTTNALPVLQASWVCGSRTNEDFFILQGDHFAEIQNLLEKAYGKSDGSIRSDVGGLCCSTNYAPAQIGVFLNLSRTWDDTTTIVSIVGKQ